MIELTQLDGELAFIDPTASVHLRQLSENEGYPRRTLVGLPIETSIGEGESNYVFCVTEEAQDIARQIKEARSSVLTEPLIDAALGG